MAGTYVTQSSWPTPKFTDEWIQEMVDLAKKAKIEKMSKSMYPQEYKIRGRRFTRRVKLNTPIISSFYKLAYDWNLDEKDE